MMHGQKNVKPYYISRSSWHMRYIL